MGLSTVTVVVGGGCAGALAAMQLLERTAGRVVLVEPAAEVGHGVAYRPDPYGFLLNSRAGSMSARPDRPDDFVSWCGRDVDRDSFVPRAVFGAYVRSSLDRATAAAPGRFTHVRGHAERIGGGPTPAVLLHDGRYLAADRIVLAVGNAAPADPPGVPDGLREDPRYVADPWIAGALDRVPAGAPVLLLGTGLTAVDVALALAARGGDNPLVAASRRGLLPLRHTERPAPHQPASHQPAPHPPAPHPPAPDWPAGTGLAGLVRAVRSAAARSVVDQTAAAPCGDWRPVIDAMRPDLDRYWSRLTASERDRFLRHLARHWEVHRHRMAPAVAHAVDRLRADGVLRIRPGTLVGVAHAAGGLTATLAGGAGLDHLTVGAVVNCTGPGRADRIALVASLLRAGTARPDPHGLGIDVDPRGHPVGADGRPVAGLQVLGPLRRGRVWETTAVPEISRQAADLAAQAAGPVAQVRRRQPATPKV